MSGWRSRASQLISGAGRATQVCRESVPFFSGQLPSQSSSGADRWMNPPPAPCVGPLYSLCVVFPTRDFTRLLYSSSVIGRLGGKDSYEMHPDNVMPKQMLTTNLFITTQSDSTASSPSSGQKRVNLTVAAEQQSSAFKW